MKNTLRYVLILPFLFLGLQIQAQEDDENIGTEEVDVIKPYTPEVSDAFKLKEMPKSEDSTSVTKKEVGYKISSVPVASTFVPAKATAARVPKAKKEHLYDSYVSFGLGNFLNGNLDFYTSRAINRDETIDVSLNLGSSQGGIDEVVLDDNYIDARVDVSYKRDLRDLQWGGGFGYQLQRYNWYGLPNDDRFTQQVIANINEEQTFQSFFFGGDVNVEDSYIKAGDAMIRLSKGDHGAGETRAYVAPSFELPIAGENITIDAELDWVIGSFDRSFASADVAQEFNFVKLGGSPSLEVLRDNLTVNLGFAAFLGWDLENSATDVFVYPRVTASYRVAEDRVIAYAGIEGDLQQNSYYDFFQENPFVSPTLIIRPNDQQYNAYLGFKGRIVPTVSYDLRGSYISDNTRALFVANGVRDDFQTTNDGYAFGNSFGVIYDDVKTFGINAEATIDVAQDFKLGAQAEYFNYETKVQTEAWNLPEFKVSISGDYQQDRWFAGANLFFVGERKDIDFLAADLLNPQPAVALDAYVDVNVNGGYRFNEQLLVFAKVNNLVGNNYEHWFNTPVQGLQVMAGLTYKFDLGD